MNSATAVSSPEIINSQSNGWQGLMTRETIKLFKQYDLFFVAHDKFEGGGFYSYRTLKGAQKRYQRIADSMVIKLGDE